MVRRVLVCWGRRHSVFASLYVLPSSNTHDTCDTAFLFSQWLEYAPPHACQSNALCHLSSSNLAMTVGIPDQYRTYMSLLQHTPPHLKQGNKKCCFHVLSLTANISCLNYSQQASISMWFSGTSIFFSLISYCKFPTQQWGRPSITQYPFLCTRTQVN